MKIKVGISNRHIHLSKDVFNYFFDKKDFLCIKELNQEGEFVSNLNLNIKTNKSEIDNVKIVGPLREKTQVEISITDAYKLGLNPPIEMSGNLNNAEDIILSNGIKELKINNCVIIANRHIHIKTSEMEKYNLYDKDVVNVRINGIRGGIMNNVIVKSKDSFNIELHIDTDEANAFNLKNGDIVEIMEEK